MWAVIKDVVNELKNIIEEGNGLMASILNKEEQSE